MNAYCTATYRCYDELADFSKKATSIAVGLTVGSWTELPEAKKEAMQPYLGQVVEINEDRNEFGERFADITIAYPDRNFSRDLPALLVTVFGKLSMDGKIKLVDLHFSPSFLSAFSGPKFGIPGVREQLGVFNRPLLMSIFKSVIGHDLPALREQFLQQALGGVDLIKDDEILFENPLSPLKERVKVGMEAAREAEQTTGQKLLYAVNLTGPTSGLIDQARTAIDAGANALLFNALAYGFDTLHELSKHPDVTVPIAAHPALAGAYYPSLYHGISAPLLLGKLMRLAGADLVLFPSPYGSVVMSKEENMAIRHNLQTDQLTSDYLYQGSPGEQSVNGTQTAVPNNASSLSLLPSFPVPSAGIHPGLVPYILRDFGGEVIVNAGGGVHGHPMGAAAGGRAFRQAIEASKQDIPLRAYGQQHEELKVAIETWGCPE